MYRFNATLRSLTSQRRTPGRRSLCLIGAKRTAEEDATRFSVRSAVAQKFGDLCVATFLRKLQGRFPIRVELKSLTMEDFIAILTEPKSSLVKQYTALLETEGLKLEFTREALDEIANFAFRVNESTENIGARRLHTIMERVLDQISFDAPEMTEKTVVIDASYVNKMLSDIVKDQDLSRYIL